LDDGLDFSLPIVCGPFSVSLYGLKWLESSTSFRCLVSFWLPREILFLCFIEYYRAVCMHFWSILLIIVIAWEVFTYFLLTIILPTIPYKVYVYCLVLHLLEELSVASRTILREEEGKWYFILPHYDTWHPSIKS
jgi:hypothetical protein